MLVRDHEGHVGLSLLCLIRARGVAGDDLYLAHRLIPQERYLRSKDVRVGGAVLGLRVCVDLCGYFGRPMLADQLRKVEVSDTVCTEVVHARLVFVPQSELLSG